MNPSDPVFENPLRRDLDRILHLTEDERCDMKLLNYVRGANGMWSSDTRTDAEIKAYHRRLADSSELMVNSLSGDTVPRWQKPGLYGKETDDVKGDTGVGSQIIRSMCWKFPSISSTGVVLE
ncbi:hypothetical protein BJX99DRAFT_253907 [Aspergillus californicus]